MEEKEGQGSAGNPPPQVAAGLEDQPQKNMPLPVWFFVGIIFIIYGLIILVTGLLEISHPPGTVLSRLHPAIWWGAIIAGLGGFFVFMTGPWKSEQ